jgi:Skp family chaperone for outer membrane proteins
LSKAERAEYEAGRKRIDALTKKVEATASSRAAQAEQRGEWKKMSETDTPQSEARQPYRSREKDSTNKFIDSLNAGTVKGTGSSEA